MAGLRAIVWLATTGRTVVLHGLPEQLHSILGILGWDNTPGLVIHNGPSGFRLRQQTLDPAAAYVSTSTGMRCR